MWQSGSAARLPFRVRHIDSTLMAHGWQNFPFCPPLTEIAQRFGETEGMNTISWDTMQYVVLHHGRERLVRS